MALAVARRRVDEAIHELFDAWDALVATETTPPPAELAARVEHVLRASGADAAPGHEWLGRWWGRRGDDGQRPVGLWADPARRDEVRARLEAVIDRDSAGQVAV